jgi:hypothetical protein
MSDTLATALGKAHALDMLAMRREQNKDKQPIDNSKFYAGSPMYFDCLTCRATITVPETYITRPKLCPQCQALKDCGWLEE